ncbi:unnamed protein product [Fusarium fujikuroi]|nr:unnamed protein product [Fusarium fujikuroi]
MPNNNLANPLKTSINYFLYKLNISIPYYLRRNLINPKNCLNYIYTSIKDNLALLLSNKVKDNLFYFKDRLYILLKPNLKKEILRLYYNNPLVGHFSIKRT